MTSSNPDHPTGNIFDPRELALLAQAMEHDTRGGIRMNSRYVSWERLDHFDGVLVRVHTLSEGVRGDFGSISIALTLLWALFTTMLLISWYVIRRMVSNMYVLQSSLQWQAWHDTLTRLYNRGALFEKARPLAKLCQTHQHPFSVIQVDLDHFKAINDRFGHQAGDRVLSHAAGLISSSLRAQDVARLEALMRRTNGQASNELRHGNVMLDPGKRIATLAGEPLTLKPKEFALLELLMRNAGRVLPRKLIEEKLYT